MRADMLKRRTVLVASVQTHVLKGKLSWGKGMDE